MKSLNNKILVLLFCLLTPVSLVIVLFILSKNENHKNNSFTRLFPPHFLFNVKELELGYNSFYLAGFTKTNIFLGNKTAAALLLKTNYNCSDSNHFILKVPPDIQVVGTAIKDYVDSPDIYMMEGVTPKILHGSFDNQTMAGNGYRAASFNAFHFISKQSFAIVTYDLDKQENTLAKSNIYSGTIKRLPKVLTRRGDGVFSLDGLLMQDYYSKNLAYVYFYRNEFIFLDTNLNILSTGHTIDSIYTPEIKLSRIISSGTTTFAAPPLMVNITACMDSDYLFVNSNLRAKNENKEDFSQNSVIDIYSLKNREYVYSFYIPHYRNSKIKSFQIYNHHLIALYDHTLMTFSINY